MIPFWLHALAIVALLAGFTCALVVIIDVAHHPQHMWMHHPQHMWIMNAVWPIVALFGGPIVLWGYITYGRRHAEPPFPVIVGTGTAHCGAGCTLGDIVAEWLCFTVPAVALWFGWKSIFAEKMFAVWIVDFIFAFAFGIVFQYFAIAPMRGLPFGEGMVAALKADTLSLIAWQVGMYGFMAIAQYAYFRPLLGTMLKVDTPEFWFTMQIAMLAGFVTSYPVNWWLIKVGIKEKM